MESRYDYIITSRFEKIVLCKPWMALVIIGRAFRFYRLQLAFTFLDDIKVIKNIIALAWI